MAIPSILCSSRESQESVIKGQRGSQGDSFYGCATSKTHRAVNYPIILSGGSNLGFQHGSHLNFDEERIPLANLFVTIANQLGTPTEQFAGSTGDITEVLA